MEEHNPKKQVLQPSTPVPKQPQRRLQKSSRNEVARLVEKYPVLFWCGIWVTVLLVTAIAISGLLSPSLPGERQSSSAAFGTGPSPELETAKGGQVPVWIFGAIVLSCTAGSILVSKRLTRPGAVRRISNLPRKRKSTSGVNRPRRFTKASSPAKTNAPRRLKPFSDADFAPLEGLQPATLKPLLAASPPPVQPGSRLQPPRSSRKPQLKSAPPVTVTVVPPEEDHPLDWSDPGLADLMDIRKRRSLSSWM